MKSRRSWDCDAESQCPAGHDAVEESVAISSPFATRPITTRSSSSFFIQESRPRSKTCRQMPERMPSFKFGLKKKSQRRWARVSPLDLIGSRRRFAAVKFSLNRRAQYDAGLPAGPGEYAAGAANSNCNGHTALNQGHWVLTHLTRHRLDRPLSRGRQAARSVGDPQGVRDLMDSVRATVNPTHRRVV